MKSAEYTDGYDRGYDVGYPDAITELEEKQESIRQSVFDSVKEICDRVESDRVLGITYPREAEYIAGEIDALIRKLDQ